MTFTSNSKRLIFHIYIKWQTSDSYLHSLKIYYARIVQNNSLGGGGACHQNFTVQ